ncbi:MAG TPA: HAMP domain-containing sensor histidine kinase [Streptosporangiaceae bacterium]|jgi:hypothetical protein
MRSTVRLKFTAMYGGLFLLSGAVLLAIAGLIAGGVRVSESAPGPRPGQSPDGALAQAQARVDELQERLADAHAAATRAFLIGSLVALGVMAVVSLVLGRFVTGRVLRPLRTMTAATRRITADRLHERLGVPGPADEVKDLADTIDDLLGRLEGAFAAQRRFVANASHELRTPLTTMRASLDVAVAKPDVPAPTTALAGRLRTELDQVDRLLDGLLALARTGRDAAPYLPDSEDVALGHLVAAALADRAADAAARGITVDTEDALDEGARVRGSRALLRRMIDNVVDNAITHNRDAGWIRVATAGDGATARLVVETGGPVLDRRQVAELSQPFRRLAADRTGGGAGAGLGLSIVASVAAAHGGTLDLHARTNGGLRVTITLPLLIPVGAGL